MEESGRARRRRVLREAHGLVPERVVLHLLARAAREPVECEPRTREVVALVREIHPLDDGVDGELPGSQRDADDEKRDDGEAVQDRARGRRVTRVVVEQLRSGQRKEGRHWLGATGVGRN